MCYYNGQRVTLAEYIELKGIEKRTRDYDFLNVGVHNGFAYQPAAILCANEARNNFDIVQANWGYVPGKMTEADATAFRREKVTLNFKGENLWTSERGGWSMWAEPAIKRRCLVLSTGIIESRHIPKIGRKGQELKEMIKYPYQVGIKGKEYFWLAGLYNDWINLDTGELVRTFALGVTKANKLMHQVHNSKLRMPTILSDDLAWEWLMENPSKERLTELALTQVPSKNMEFCNIEKGYMETREAVPAEYPELKPIDMSYLDAEEFLEYPEIAMH